MSAGAWAGRVTRRWVALYTRTAPIGDAADRRAEMESDLFDQASACNARSASSRQMNSELLGRAVRGIPADIGWRLEVEQAPGRLRWHVRHPSTVLLATWAFLLPINQLADVRAADEARWSAAGLLGAATVALGAFLIAFAIVSLAVRGPAGLRPRRSTARDVRVDVLCGMAVAYAVSGIWRFAPDPLQAIANAGYVAFGLLLVLYLMLVAYACFRLVFLDFRKVSS